MMTFSRFSTTLLVIKAHKKIHSPLIKGISNALFSIFGEGKFADKVVPVLLKSNPTWGSRDRRFIAENVYDIVRYWRLYWHLSGWPVSTTEEDLTKLVAFKLFREGYELPENLAVISFPKQIADFNTLPQQIRESYPDWIHQLASNQLGELWEREARALNETANVYLRVNLSLTTADKVLSELAKSDITVTLHPTIKGCLIMPERKNIEKHPVLLNGLAEIQDAGSQLIAQYLDPLPGSLIVDACAGAGGKTLHLADLTSDQSTIFSGDTESWKLNNLLFRAQKSNFKSITTVTLPNPEFFQKKHRKIEFLLLDVPCSGLGVLKRNPDSKWKLTPEHMEYLKNTQAEILEQYTELVKPGGSVVYATCSILPEENELQVDKFLQSNPDFSLVKDHHQWPSRGTDGFYMALLKRK